MTTERTPVLTDRSGSTEPAASDSILHHISRAYHELASAFERFVGMSRARWAILNRLSREENLTQAALAQLLNVDAAAITRQVKQLEAEGLVTRWPSPEDNRFTVVALTPHGREFVAKLRSERDTFEQIATQGLSADDVELMRRCLMHIRRNLEAHSQKE